MVFVRIIIAIFKIKIRLGFDQDILKFRFLLLFIHDWHQDLFNPYTDLSLNHHPGARGIMSPGSIQDPEGARTLVISFRTAAGAATAVLRQKFTLICYTDPGTGRLRLDRSLTSGARNGTQPGTKIALLYSALPHHKCSITHHPLHFASSQ